MNEFQNQRNIVLKKKFIKLNYLHLFEQIYLKRK